MPTLDRAVPPALVRVHAAAPAWRSLASPEEFAACRWEGQALATAMVILSGAGFALGQACRLACNSFG